MYQFPYTGYVPYTKPLTTTTVTETYEYDSEGRVIKKVTSTVGESSLSGGSYTNG